MGKLMDLLSLDRILPDLKAIAKTKAFEEMARVLGTSLDIDDKMIVDALMERESTRSTALEKTGVAIPHARLNGISKFIMLFARSKNGIDFQAEDGEPSHLFFLIVGPENQPGEYLRLLARVARLCHNEKFRNRLLQAKTAQHTRDIIAEEDSKG